MEPTSAPIPGVSPPIIAAFSPPKRTKSKRKLVIFIILGVVVVMVVLGAVIHHRTPPISVQTEKVSRRNITEIVVANGKIQPVTQAVISPEVAGEITALPVKEGDDVKKGDLLVKIKPDNYQATRDSDEASYRSAIANENLAKAQLEKAEIEYKRNQELSQNKLISDSDLLGFKTDFDVAKMQVENATHLVDQAKFTLDNAEADLKKTTIVSPIDGTVVKLNSHLGERVLGTSFNMGTEIMTIADLSEIEAQVDVGEMDVVLMKPGQNAHLEVDAFKDRKFNGIVTEVADSANGFGQNAAAAAMSGGGGGGSSTTGDATKFEVHIRLKEKEQFRPGMSVTAEIETRLRTNVLSVPIASVTARMPKTNPLATNAVDPPPKTNSGSAASSSNSVAAKNSASDTNYLSRADKKAADENKQVDVVFVFEGDHVKMVPVKIGISDDNYWEVTDGLKEGDEVVSGGYHAISHDLEDGKKVVKGKAMPGDAEKKPL